MLLVHQPQKPVLHRNVQHVFPTVPPTGPKPNQVHFSRSLGYGSAPAGSPSSVSFVVIIIISVTLNQHLKASRIQQGDRRRILNWDKKCMCRKNIFCEHIVSGGQIRLGLEHNDDDAAAENVQFVISGELLERKRQWVGHYKSAKCQQTCYACIPSHDDDDGDDDDCDDD